MRVSGLVFWNGLRHITSPVRMAADEVDGDCPRRASGAKIRVQRSRRRVRMLWMDSVPSDLYQATRMPSQDDREDGRRYGVGNAGHHMDEVGGHGAEDAHHDDGGPVRPGVVAGRLRPGAGSQRPSPGRLDGWDAHGRRRGTAEPAPGTTPGQRSRPPDTARRPGAATGRLPSSALPTRGRRLSRGRTARRFRDPAEARGLVDGQIGHVARSGTGMRFPHPGVGQWGRDGFRGPHGRGRGLGLGLKTRRHGQGAVALHPLPAQSATRRWPSPPTG